MKVLNIYAAFLAALLGAIEAVVGMVDKDTTALGFGVSLLISALLFGTFSSALGLLESIRDRVGKP